MEQKENIVKSFSDAYLLALLEERDSEAIVANFKAAYPELADTLDETAATLLSLHRGNGTKQNLASLTSDPQPPDLHQAHLSAAESSAESTPFERLKSFFSESPTWSGASLGIGLAFVIAIFWQPWNIKESEHEGAEQTEKIEHHESHEAAGEKKSDGQVAVESSDFSEVIYKPRAFVLKLTPLEMRRDDTLDFTRIKGLDHPTRLSQPEHIISERIDNKTILIRWQPVEGALSYRLELSSTSGEEFYPLAQVRNSGIKISSLEPGKKYHLRIRAESGQRAGDFSEGVGIEVE
ncbi:MAG: fibronectin type III domain-containing protein [bacterium]